MAYLNDSKPSGITTGDSLSYLTLWADPIALWSSAISTTVDSYSETNRTLYEELDSASVTRVGQSFTGIAAILSFSKFYLKKTGSPTGTAVATLYAHTGTFGSGGNPSGSALATSDTFDVSTLTGSYQLITFTFTGANRYTLVNGTKYFTVIEYSGGDSFNFVNVGIRIIGTDDGNESRFQGGFWNAQTFDVCFYVFGDVTSQSYTWANPQTYSKDTKPSAGSYSNDTKPT